MMKIRLTRKFADVLNGVDLSHAHAGEEIELPKRDAQMLIAEGWAAPASTANDEEPRRGHRTSRGSTPR